MASGDTKTEALLNILGNGGTGDEYRGSGNTKTQNYILDAIDRINALDPSSGGAFKALSASDVTGKDPDGNDIIELWKLPSGIYTFDISEDDSYCIVANTSYDEGADIYYPDWTFSEEAGIVDIYSPGFGMSSYTVFTPDGVIFFCDVNDEFGLVNFDNIYPANAPFSGADSSTDGMAGLVPAPTVSDVGKFLYADGTWQPAATNIVDLAITGASGSDVNVTASEYLDDLVAKIDSGVECVFKLTVPSNSGLPLSGTFLFRVSNYFSNGTNIWCFSPFYDNSSNVMYMLKFEFVPVNGNYHTQSAVVHIFMP